MSDGGADQDTDTKNGRAAPTIGLFLGPVIMLFMLAVGPQGGLEPPAWRAAAVALWMAAWWMTEPVPIPITALLPLALFPLLGVNDLKAVAAPYAHPLVFLFLGGFVIALAMQRWELHRRIALKLISVFGTRPANLIAGFMVATAVLSMWVSNTATTMMMLPIALSVVALLSSNDRTLGASGFAVALMLGIAYSASIGGIGTLIGTPPNVFMAGFMNDVYGVSIGFGQWMLIGLPLVAVLLPIAWVLLTRIVCRVPRVPAHGSAELFQDALSDMGAMSRGEKIVLIVFALTAGAWIFRPLLADALPGVRLDDTVIAIAGALVLFAIPVHWRTREFAMNWEWAQKVPWGVLLLFGGGLSLSSTIKATGLADWIGGSTQALGGMPPVLIVVAVTALIIFLTELTSNTATTATFLPIVASVAVGLGENPFLLVVPAALAASCAFMMPVATPPNAIVFGSGHVTIGQMIRAGVWLNLIGVGVITGVGYSVMLLVLGIEPGVVPDWAVP